GDRGRILAGFRGENPRVISGQESDVKPPTIEGGRQRGEALALWAAAVKGGKPTYGDFLLAGPISDAFNLGAVSLRLGGRRLLFDSVNMKITNLPTANNYLTREYRPGWELTGA